MYAAFSDQQEQKRGIEESAKDLRVKAARWMKEHPKDFIHFCTNEETGDVMTEEEFVDYCEKMEHSDEWGGHCEIVALSQALKCDVVVFYADAPELCVYYDEKEKQQDPFRVTYHKFFYGLGEHYNSVTKKQEEDE